MTADTTDPLSLARAALDAYDYDGARVLLERALLSGASGVEAAQLLLELLVDVLGVDAEALALEPKLSRAARRDVQVRCRLGTAAARVGDTTAALAWVEGVDAPEAANALVPCARRELEAGQLESCQALLERAQRLAPMDPAVGDLSRALGEEKRFRTLVLEEELDGLLARGDTVEAERAARALRARDGRNAKALAVLEGAERARAEATARELLARQVSEPPALAERPQRIQQLRAAARAPLPDALRRELLDAAVALEAAAAEAARESAIEPLLGALRPASTATAPSVATLAALYLELPEATRRVARERTAEPAFDWLEALGASAPLQRSVLRALDALKRALALEAANPEANVEAALALIEPELRTLQRLPEAGALHARLTAARQRAAERPRKRRSRKPRPSWARGTPSRRWSSSRGCPAPSSTRSCTDGPTRSRATRRRRRLGSAWSSSWPRTAGEGTWSARGTRSTRRSAAACWMRTPEPEPSRSGGRSRRRSGRSSR